MKIYGVEIKGCGCGNDKPELEHIYPDHDIFVRIKCNCGMGGALGFQTKLKSAAQEWNELQED